MIVQRAGAPHRGRGGAGGGTGLGQQHWEWYAIYAMAVSKPPLRPQPTKEHPDEPDLAARRKLLEQILKLRDTIEAEKGILSDSVSLIREDRER